MTLGMGPQDPIAAAAPRLRVRNIGSWDETVVMHPAWNELLAASASRTVFLTREWLQAWWDVYGDAGELMLLVCLEDGGSVVGVAPLFRTRRRVGPGWSVRVLRFLGDDAGDSNLDLIVREGLEVAAVRALADYLEAARSEWDLLELNHVPAESAVASVLARELAARSWRGVAREAPRRVIGLSETWEGHVRRLSKKMRRAATYQVRHLERLHYVRLCRCGTAAELSRFLEEFFRLHTERWQRRGEAGNFSLPLRRRFYAEAARRLQVSGWLDLWLLHVDGRPVAAEFGCRYGDTYSLLDGGFDPEYEKLSVGVVLTALVLRRLIAEGVRWYDFQEGDESYKARWGAGRRAYRYLCSAPPWSRGARYLALVSAAAQAKGWLRDRVPGLWGLLGGWYRRLRPAHADVAGPA